MTAPGDLLQALFMRLKSDASLTALLGGAGLREQAADSAAFPYVTYGRTSAFDLDTGADNDDDQLITLHVWSKAQGEAETRLIMDSIRARLDGAAFATGSRDQTRLSLEFAEARYDEDLALHHGVIRIRAITQSADLNLRLDLGLVDDRPHLADATVPKFVENILGERHALAVHRQAEQHALGVTVEMQARRHARRLADQQFDVETEIGNGLEIAFEHAAIARQAEHFAIVLHLVADKLSEIGPVLGIQAGDVAPVEVGKVFIRHGALRWFGVSHAI